MWVKQLLLGDSQGSWVLHSPNVSLARISIFIEREEYDKNCVDFDTCIKVDHVRKGAELEKIVLSPGG